MIDIEASTWRRRNATEEYRNLLEVLGVGTSRRWFKKFNVGDSDLSVNPRYVRPSLFDDDTINIMIEQDPFLKGDCERGYIPKKPKLIGYYESNRFSQVNLYSY